MPPGCRRRPETPEGRSIVVLAEETYETYGVRVRPTGWVKHLLQEVWRVSQRDKTIHLRVYMAQLRRKWRRTPRTRATSSPSPVWGTASKDQRPVSAPSESDLSTSPRPAGHAVRTQA